MPMCPSALLSEQKRLWEADAIHREVWRVMDLQEYINATRRARKQESTPYPTFLVPFQGGWLVLNATEHELWKSLQEK